MLDHANLLRGAPTKYSISQSMGYPKGRSAYVFVQRLEQIYFRPATTMLLKALLYAFSSVEYIQHHF